MASNGIMEDIRNLLSQGKSSTEVIVMGYRPPTVYKVQRQLRNAGKGRGQGAQSRIPARDGALTTALECAEVESEASSYHEEKSELSALRDQLTRLEAKVDHLAVVLGDAALRGGVSAWTQETFRVILENRSALHCIGRRLGLDSTQLFPRD